MTPDEKDARTQELLKEGQIKNSRNVRIPLVLNQYQLSNVLRAIRLSENSGDWYHEVLGKIDYQLRESGLCLDEGYKSDLDKWIMPFIGRPNLPYPENWVTYNGKKPTVQ